jgi:ribose 5-phosphate isomerase B
VERHSVSNESTAASSPDHDAELSAVAIGSDDAGYALKEAIAARLRESGYPVTDFGCYSPEPVDYPDVAFSLASAVATGEFTRGILICGTGIGMAIAANKVPGVRAAQAHDPYSAERARKSNDAQILTLGARVVGPELALSLVDTWLHAEFAGGASARKVGKIIRRERELREQTG